MSITDRPSSYSPHLCELVLNYCLLGVTNDELAEFFGVSPRTIDNWIAGHPEFPEAVQRGRDVADATVVESLFTCVAGYDHRPEKVFVHRGPPRMATYGAHVPPETRACTFWLRNRRPEDGRAQAETTPEVDAAGEIMRPVGDAGETVRYSPVSLLGCTTISLAEIAGIPDQAARRAGHSGR